jgi:hypothetical protein
MYFLVKLNRQQIWWPIIKGESPFVIEFPIYKYLFSQPAIFLIVTLFKEYSSHSALIFPIDTWQANLFNIPPLYVCCYAGYFPLTLDISFGCLVYTFQLLIHKLFLKHKHLIHNIFEGVLVVSEIYNFLNKCHIYMYGNVIC